MGIEKTRIPSGAASRRASGRPRGTAHAQQDEPERDHHQVRCVDPLRKDVEADARGETERPEHGRSRPANGLAQLAAAPEQQPESDPEDDLGRGVRGLEEPAHHRRVGVRTRSQNARP
jgi:hypothetical protein